VSLTQTARLSLGTASAAAKGPSTPEWQLSTNPNVFWVKGSFRSKRYVDRCSRRMLLRHCCGCQTLDLSSRIDHSINHMKGQYFFWIEGGTETSVPFKYATGREGAKMVYGPGARNLHSATDTPMHLTLHSGQSDVPSAEFPQCLYFCHLLA